MPMTVASAVTFATAIPSGPGVLVGEHRFSCFAWAAVPDIENQGHKRRYGLNSLSTSLPIWSINLYQNMAEDHICKGVGECHPYREFEGMQPSR